MSTLVPFPQPPRLATSTSEMAGASPSPTHNTIPQKGGTVSLPVPKCRRLFVSRIPCACLPVFDPSSLPRPAQPWEGRVASFPGATRTSGLRGEHRTEALLGKKEGKQMQRRQSARPNRCLPHADVRFCVWIAGDSKQVPPSFS